MDPGELLVLDPPGFESAADAFNWMGERLRWLGFVVDLLLKPGDDPEFKDAAVAALIDLQTMCKLLHDDLRSEGAALQSFNLSSDDLDRTWFALACAHAEAEMDAPAVKRQLAPIVQALRAREQGRRKASGTVPSESGETSAA